jgi:uncharacterized protein (DUF58 family)
MLLLLAPAAVVPLLKLALSLPSLLLWNVANPAAHGSRISDAQFGWGLLLAAAIAIAAWLVGNRYGSRLANRRRQWLTAFLTDPDRG